MSYSLSSRCRRSSMLQVHTFDFNETKLIMPRTQLNCYSKRRRTSLVLLLSGQWPPNSPNLNLKD